MTKCVFCLVTFRLRQHINVKHASAIGWPPTTANDFYWRGAWAIWCRCDVMGAWGNGLFGFPLFTTPLNLDVSEMTRLGAKLNGKLLSLAFCP